MALTSLTKVYLRDLNKLISEIELYENEEDLWKKAAGINNSAGNLSLHIAGNLQHFIGAQLGNTGYIRKRDQEFGDTGISREKIISGLNHTMQILEKVLPTISAEKLAKPFPQKLGAAEYTVEELLYHLLSHLSYHVGQVNYHRRLLNN